MAFTWLPSGQAITPGLSFSKQDEAVSPPPSPLDSSFFLIELTVT